MSGPGDIGGEVSGEEAAWRDLIARFDVPDDRTGTGVPWPASEDLQDTPGSSEAAGSASAATPNLSPADTAGPSTADGGGQAEQGRRSVEQGGPGPAQDAQGSADNTATQADRQGSSDSSGRPEQIPGPSGQPVISFTIPADRTRVVRPAGDPRSYTPADEQDEPYVPEPLPPPAKLDSMTKAALVGVIGGPGYLLIASVFMHWTISAEAALLAVAAFVGGFVTLVIKLGDRSGRDDDDDGAVL